MLRPYYQLIFGVSISLLLTACNTVGNGFVAKGWISNMQELGITPIFPPRQDFRIGQVYVNIVNIEASDKLSKGYHSGFVQMGTYLAALDLNDELRQYYAKRSDFTVSDIDSPAELPFSSEKANVITLKPVAFPGFLKATAKGADLGALIPAGGLPFGTNIGIDSIESASITVSAAESYSLPWLLVAKKLYTNDGNIELGANSVQILKTMSGQLQPGYSLILTVISEVFYARSFDTSFHLNSNAALALAKQLPANKKLSKTDVLDASTKAISSLDSSPETSATVAIAPSEQVLAQTIANGETKKMEEAKQHVVNTIPSTPGVSLGVAYNATGEITLRRTYTQPIAIGYRGLSFKINVADDKVTPDEFKDPTLTPFSTDPNNGGVDLGASAWKG